MPPKKKFEDISVPQWVRDIEDRCLRDVVLEAHVARFAAIEEGAKNHPACRAALASADATMDQIRYGRYIGTEACRKAAVAVRKYDTARECASPTASRYSRKARDVPKPRRTVKRRTAKARST